VNKMSRVLICCQDGGARSGIAAKLVADAGFTSIVTVEGGMDAYLAASPLTEKVRQRGGMGHVPAVPAVPALFVIDVSFACCACVATHRT
jgi:hypothetical protein